MRPCGGEMQTNFLAIDPGTHNTGYAFWHKLVPEKLPMCTGVLKAPNNMPWVQCWNQQCERLDGILKDYNVQHMFLETVELWTGNATSVSSAGTGKLFKLAYLIGGMWRVAVQRDVHVQLCTATLWKGQLSKEAVIKRIKRHYGPAIDLFDHQADAVGMGLHCMGML